MGLEQLLTNIVNGAAKWTTEKLKDPAVQRKLLMAAGKAVKNKMNKKRW